MKSEAKVMNYKLNSHPDATIRKLSNIDLNREQEHDSILRNKESDILLPKYNFEFPYQVIIPSREEWILNKYDERNATNFFTDGSKTLDGDLEFMENLKLKKV